MQTIPIKKRRAPTIAKAWKLIQDRFAAGGLKPNTWVLDNEASALLKEATKENETTYQLVPPNNYKTNAVDRVI